ncbi:C-type lectin domain family 4 member E [Merluccius polli]|uniref:C-type lectin domain family 4 member E n=1 Tax=Merluccius polli TaxID=89951 RepID=A0AA47LZN6_MERPO|nr:C-type lectin domain family 4 member E [Merluccius polli]
MYYNHRLYFISTAMENWTASRDDCLERDADLIVINSREEQLCCHDNRYHYYLKQEFVSMLGGTYWIGLSKRDPEGTWKWVDGTNMTNMTSSFWLPGEPSDNYGAENCAVKLERGGPWRGPVGRGPSGRRSGGRLSEGRGQLVRELGMDWMDGSCAELFPWICEKAPGPGSSEQRGSVDFV